jgi:hypothetical protein
VALSISFGIREGYIIVLKCFWARTTVLKRASNKGSRSMMSRERVLIQRFNSETNNLLSKGSTMPTTRAPHPSHSKL